MSSEQPSVLAIGATGQTGRLIVAEFDRDPGNVRLRLTARKPADIEKLRAAGKEAVHLDLDDPQTFGTALAGVDRLFLLTGYTVDMLVQSKNLVVSAREAGVSLIRRLGIFAVWGCHAPYIRWNSIIYKDIETSGVHW